MKQSKTTNQNLTNEELIKLIKRTPFLELKEKLNFAKADTRDALLEFAGWTKSEFMAALVQHQIDTREQYLAAANDIQKWLQNRQKMPLNQTISDDFDV